MHEVCHSAVHCQASKSTTAGTTYNVVDLYETSDCGDSSSPSRAIFTPSTNCEPSLTCAANSAFSDMGYGTTSCTNDFTSHAEVVERKFSDDSCTTESQVLAFTADSDLCVAQGTDKGVKWSVTGTGEVDLISYASSDCSGNSTSASRTKAADVSSHSCVDKQKFYVIGAEARRYVMTTYYSDAFCSTPSRIDFDVEAQGMICPESTQCSKSFKIDGFYKKTDCVLNYKKFAADTFGTHSSPYSTAPSATWTTRCSHTMLTARPLRSKKARQARSPSVGTSTAAATSRVEAVVGSGVSVGLSSIEPVVAVEGALSARKAI